MRTFASITLALAAVLAGCARPESSGAILKVGNGAEPEALDPHIVTGVPEHHVLAALFEGLVSLDPKDLSVVPGVAERWDVSEDAMHYVFHLRENAKWSNGDPVTAHDFVYAWQRILTPALAAEYAYMLYCIENAQAFNEGKITDFAEVGAKALDDRTLEVTLAFPAPYFFSLHTHESWYPVHKATIEKFGTMTDRISKWTRPGNMVCNGPYILAAWEPNAVIRCTPNPYYWNAENVANAGVEFYPVSDEQVEERMFRAGQLHVTENVPVNKVEVYKKDTPELFRADPWIGSYFYRVNTTRPPLNDVRVRRALAMAIDRDSICTKVLKAGDTPAPFVTPPNINGYVPSARVEFNPERARELLAEAGYPNGQGMRKIDILYNTSDQHRIIAEAIQQMWKQHLGIEVSLSNQDWKVYLASTANNNLDFDIARAGWIGDFVDPINFLECFITNNGNNRTGWSNAEYDRILAEAYRLPGYPERNKLYDQAEKILVEEMPVLPIYHYVRDFLIQREVQNFHGNILGFYRWDKIAIGPAPGG